MSGSSTRCGPSRLWYFRFLITPQDHPNVIKLFEIYQDPENVYLVQE